MKQVRVEMVLGPGAVPSEGSESLSLTNDRMAPGLIGRNQLFLIGKTIFLRLIFSGF